jgi:predicted nucleotidyltransferase
VLRIAAAHGAGNVRVFGSAGRGEQSGFSDLDLLVDMAEGRSLFDLIALSNELEESLGVEVDVLTEASLSPYLRDRILDEAVAL